MRKLFRVKKYNELKKQNQEIDKTQEKVLEEIPYSIEGIKEKLRKIFLNSSDFVLRELITEQNQQKIMIAYIDGLSDKNMLTQNILQPIMNNRQQIIQAFSKGNQEIFRYVKYDLLYSCEMEDTKDFQSSVEYILSGDTLLYIEGQQIALKLCTKGWEQRGIEQPETEMVIRGPREGFTETLRINTSMIRRIIKNPNLKFEQMMLGEQTRTDVCICYIQGIASDVIIQTVRNRLQQIKIDAILESGYIEEFIEDAPYSVFSTVGNSEKPDVVAGKLLEGRIAILCDGTPFVLTVPYLFIESLQSPSDYYSRSYISSFTRLLRFLSLLITIFAPTLYVALLGFHLGSIPFSLLLSIAADREGVPFPAFVEALIMIIFFELLREAGVRMPKVVGQAVSIVGALILGEAAVDAGLASNLLVIVVSLMAITSFIVTPQPDGIMFIRLSLLVAANILGFMGIILSTFVFVAHMCDLKSFGVPYLSPFAPLDTMGLTDTYIRAPWWAMLKRPKVILWGNREELENRVQSTNTTLQNKSK
ncbi:spore germination protein [Irregularibacter muris]|uniref:Spore germination protein n=1 Tax=Irregularibacter muris TaxID=1796619 RepID=A0AAE3KZU9_9FIRM|nr:spore germination protein [Irregularibacter muris]MCR1899760.1 spore germination protein [Irregularibacter muris]